MDEVLNPYSVRANGVVRNYLYPKWVYINSEYVRIDPESKVNVTTGVGDSVIHDKLYNTVGIVKMGFIVFVGLRPDVIKVVIITEFSIRGAYQYFSYSIVLRTTLLY